MGAWGFCNSTLLCKHVFGWLILDFGIIHACTVGFCKTFSIPTNCKFIQSNFLWILLTDQTPSTIPVKIIVVTICMVKLLAVMVGNY